ncbi:MAG: peroxidase [Proteobacteria bacterium]|nr:peroxidase [Pseudomonadota bacterium]
MQVDYDDIQGLVRFGHGRLTEARFHLLRIADLAAARQWLAAAPVTHAAEQYPLPDTALQIAFSAEGLRALGIEPAVLDGFSAEFRSGMAGDLDRSRRLGDVAGNDPATWTWGTGDRAPHLLVMVYATPARFPDWQAQLQDQAWERGFSLIASLDTGDRDGREPFGFIDGISQPIPDWDRRLRPEPGEARYRNDIALGEFVLGYPNEYGKYTDRPLLDPAADPQGRLPWAEDLPELRDLGRNGTYLVFRDLHQSVRAFWQYLNAQTAGTGVTAQHLAERMVGRRLADGAPLVPVRSRGAPGSDGPPNAFTFDDDPAGAQCPLGAHIRRANPRTADVPPGTVGFLARLIQTLGLNRQDARDDLIAPARFHRILRRGREYGQGGPGISDDVGLRFLCVNANIARQFEFVQSAWIMSTKFNGMAEEGDPLLGNRAPIPGCPVTDRFVWSREGSVRRRLAGLPQFVTVQGGAYFFMPGIRALRYLAAG